VPVEWARLWAIDPGIGHAFGAALIAWDREADVIHVLHVIKVKDQIPHQHPTAMKAIAAGVRVAYPHDAAARDRGSGQPISEIYRSHGLLMLPTHATHPDGGFSTEAGILEMHERMKTGRFKVAAHCRDFFAEFRGYARKDGVMVKLNDDVLSSVWVGVMARRFAQPGPLGPYAPPRSTTPQFIDGHDIHPFDDPKAGAPGDDPVFSDYEN
jgi:hypothetical protein